jgi:MFS family permease
MGLQRRRLLANAFAWPVNPGKGALVADHTVRDRSGRDGHEVPARVEQDNRRPVRKVLVSSFLGSTIEFYDFLLFTSASSVVFPAVFFANLPPLTATIASFGTLAVGFVARPIGGFVFGSVGDRLGRKRTLVITMLLMGGASTAMGLLPTYAAIGALAPLLLVLLRLVQGLAVGGEWGGATAMSLEHAPTRRRGVAVALIASGAPMGSLLASGSMGLAAAVSGDAFLTWGWRVPFLLSAVLVGVGLYIRTSVADSPHFVAAASENRLVARPVRHILRHHWAALLRVTLVVLPAFTLQGLIVSFALNYAVTHGAQRSEALFLLTVSSIGAVAACVLAGVASDRFGRRTLMLVGTISSAVLAFPMFWLLETGTSLGILLCFVLGHSLCQSVLAACAGAFIGEMFPVEVRTTASGAGYQLAGVIGGFTPLIAATLLQATGSLAVIAAILVGVAVVATIAAMAAKESLGQELS